MISRLVMVDSACVFLSKVLARTSREFIGSRKTQFAPFGSVQSDLFV